MLIPVVRRGLGLGGVAARRAGQVSHILCQELSTSLILWSRMATISSAWSSVIISGGPMASQCSS